MNILAAMVTEIVKMLHGKMTYMYVLSATPVISLVDCKIVIDFLPITLNIRFGCSI